MTRTWLALRRHPNSGILLLVTVSLLIGLATFRQYGMSWDEPLFYRYAEAIPKAYSITARLNGTFRLEDAYGPSSDHGRYGPAYLLLARWPVLALQNLPSVDEAAAWHLVNFLTFQAGVLVFYLLLRRWVGPLAAWSSAALFATQPVLWGHAFMNPKDMPFMVFFIFSIYTGLRMVDAASLNSPAAAVAPALWRRAAWVCLALLAGMLASLGLALWLFPGGMAQLARNLLALAYADPASLPGQLFSLLTVNARNAPLEVYEIKLARLLALARWVSLAAALALGACWALIRYARPLPERLLGWLKVNVPPAPVLLAALALGLTTSIRILGPLAGVIVGLVFLIKWRQRALIPLAFYGLAAFLVCYITWPYLWGGPLDQFFEVLTRNANNPERVRLLFAGQITYSDELPPTYLPTMLAWTLTEPTWLLALAGVAAALGMRKKQWDWHTLLPITLWLIAPLVYVFAAQPPLYDGFRHFMFIIPGIFILAALALENILMRIQKTSLRMGLLLALMSPSIIGYTQLHPYEYAYYNAFSGGTRAVFRQYETEYWLTCYKEAFDYINNNAAGQPVFVQRNLRLAQYYARPGLSVSFIPDGPLPSGSLVLQTTRTNGDQITLPDLPIVHQVQRAGAAFCVTKQVP